MTNSRNNRCPASGQTCKKCRRSDTLLVCRSSKPGSRGPSRTKSTNNTDAVSVHPPEDHFFPWWGWVLWGCRSLVHSFGLVWSTVHFKIDTGADISVISHAAWQALKYCPQLQQTSVKLNSPGGKLQVHGIFTATISHKGTDFTFPVVVIEGTGTANLLARAVAVKMGLVTHRGLTPSRSLIFTGSVFTRLMPPGSSSITSSAVCVTSACRIPFPLMDKDVGQQSYPTSDRTNRVVCANGPCHQAWW